MALPKVRIACAARLTSEFGVAPYLPLGTREDESSCCGKASPFAILRTKSHCRVVCADGLPGVLCSLHGASSISSNVYLGFICPCGLTLGFIFRLPPAAPGSSSFWTAATCRCHTEHLAT